MSFSNVAGGVLTSDGRKYTVCEPVFKFSRYGRRVNTRRGMFWMWSATALVVGGALYIGYEAALPCIAPQVIVQLGVVDGYLCPPQAFAAAVGPATSVVASVMLVLVLFATALRAINRHRKERLGSDVNDALGRR